MLKEQGNVCAISGAPLFIGDEIEVDHSIPLSIGGADSTENLQIVHKDSNRIKGAKPPSE
ncbi:MAG: HNH endonuclease [Nodularia sp. CChRGM 3473]